MEQNVTPSAFPVLATGGATVATFRYRVLWILFHVSKLAWGTTAFHASGTRKLLLVAVPKNKSAAGPTH